MFWIFTDLRQERDKDGPDERVIYRVFNKVKFTKEKKIIYVEDFKNLKDLGHSAEFLESHKRANEFVLRNVYLINQILVYVQSFKTVGKFRETQGSIEKRLKEGRGCFWSQAKELE